MKPLEKITAISVPVAMLALGLIIMPFYNSSTADLNRKKSERPPITFDAMTSGDYFVKLSSYLEDSLPFRSYIRHLDATIDYRFFGDSPNPVVTLGKQGWLFHTDSLQRPLKHSSFNPDDVLDTIVSLKETVEKNGRTFRFSVAPQKLIVFPEFVADEHREKLLAVQERSQTLRQYLYESNIDGYFDVWGELIDNRYTKDGTPIYFPKDTHWKMEGAKFQARALIESLRPGLWNENAIKEKQNDYWPDLNRLAGLKNRVPNIALSTKRPKVETTLKVNGRRMGLGDFQVFTSTASDPDITLLPKIVVVHDSFGARMRNMLSPYFKEAVFVNFMAFNQGFDEEVINDAEIVYINRAERFVYSVKPGSVNDALQDPRLYSFLGQLEGSQ